MALQSMTGFARATSLYDGFEISWEMRSVNGKGLDLRFRLPAGYEVLEIELRRLAAQKLSRGNVQLSLSIDSPHEQSVPKINIAYLESLIHEMKTLESRFSMPPVHIEGLLGLRGVIDNNVAELSDEQKKIINERVLSTFIEALDALVAMRNGEGKKLKALIVAHVETMAQLTDQARSDPARQTDAIRDRLKQQIAPLVTEIAELEPERLYIEAALLATRADIQEELDRLDAHIAATRALLDEGGAIGRKLDFLAQEFNREANTLCAKANVPSLSATGLALKAVIDQYREQIQNLE